MAHLYRYLVELFSVKRYWKLRLINVIVTIFLTERKTDPMKKYVNNLSIKIYEKIQLKRTGLVLFWGTNSQPYEKVWNKRGYEL